MTLYHTLTILAAHAAVASTPDIHLFERKLQAVEIAQAPVVWLNSRDELSHPPHSAKGAIEHIIDFVGINLARRFQLLGRLPGLLKHPKMPLGYFVQDLRSDWLIQLFTKFDDDLEKKVIQQVVRLVVSSRSQELLHFLSDKHRLRTGASDSRAELQHARGNQTGADRERQTYCYTQYRGDYNGGRPIDFGKKHGAATLPLVAVGDNHGGAA